MDFLRVFITAPLSIITLFFLSKMIGNKQISNMNIFDYINGITIGSIAAEMATSRFEMEKYMDFREQIRFVVEREIQGLKRVPEWARAEHMEMSVPLKELWNYPDSLESKNNNILTVIFKKMKRKK